MVAAVLSGGHDVAVGCKVTADEKYGNTDLLAELTRPPRAGRRGDSSRQSPRGDGRRNLEAGKVQSPSAEDGSDAGWRRLSGRDAKQYSVPAHDVYHRRSSLTVLRSNRQYQELQADGLTGVLGGRSCSVERGTLPGGRGQYDTLDRRS
jgi:hypothetical protein